MFRQFSLLMFRISGWKVDTNVPPELKRCIVIAAPHTSNWDFWYTMLAFSIMRFNIRFTIKKEWMRFPFSIFTKPAGGIAIDRSPKAGLTERISQTEAMTNLFKVQENLIVLVTPEGTRSRREEWKTGFYYTAVGAGVPICLGYVDYRKKTAGIGKTIYPAQFESDMKAIMTFYKGISGKFPEKFSVDKRYE